MRIPEFQRNVNATVEFWYSLRGGTHRIKFDVVNTGNGKTSNKLLDDRWKVWKKVAYDITIVERDTVSNHLCK